MSNGLSKKTSVNTTALNGCLSFGLLQDVQSVQTPLTALHDRTKTSWILIKLT
ncbi:hypothetical protein GW750_01660 [bacterium]|nr:hypothetical protein [bacterium]